MTVYDGVPNLDRLTPDEWETLLSDLPEAVSLTLGVATRGDDRTIRPATPADQARILDRRYRARPHVDYLSARLAAAVADVENGSNRYLRVSMPPRSGKSLLTSVYLPVWLLSKHPEWRLGLISHDPTLAAAWGREVRSMIDQHGSILGLGVARDAGAVSNWQTTAGGGIVARSAPGQSLTGLGFKVLIVDDAVKDFAAAHSAKMRDALWEWWKSNAFTRMEPPALVIVVGTRWHQDDLLGRLASHEYEGNPADWEVIEFPAVAEAGDVLGREPGDPLFSPLLDETRDEALDRWGTVKTAVGAYSWAALYQQRPAPAEGAIFDISAFRYWTADPEHASDNVRLLTPAELRHATWLDSWDLAFKGSDESDFVVGQRWCRIGPYRILVGQTRGRRTFTQTLAEMRRWCDPHLTPHAAYVHRRLVEDKANGPAIIETLKDEIAGLKPVNPDRSKEARMRAVTPEVESGHVLLPYPGGPGFGWVRDLIEELREAPHGAHDDQVDALTMALLDLREVGSGFLAIPGGAAGGPALSGSRVAAAHSERRRYRR